MRLDRWLMLGACLASAALMIGCGGDSSSSSTAGGDTAASGDPIAAGPGSGRPLPTTGRPGGGGPPTDVLPPVDTVPVPIKDGVAELTPANTLIQFVGVHTDATKMNRVGGFEKFTGQIKVDEAAKKVESINVDIEVESLFSFDNNLTAHLKRNDFLNAPEYPQIKFVSKSITPDAGDPNRIQIVGDLTLHGTTKEVSFPATTTFEETGFTLKSEFEIDRTEYGMNMNMEGVKKEVALTIFVGEKTRKPLTPEQASPGGGIPNG